MLYEAFPAETRLTVYRGAPVGVLDAAGYLIRFSTMLYEAFPAETKLTV